MKCLHLLHGAHHPLEFLLEIRANVGVLYQLYAVVGDHFHWFQELQPEFLQYQKILLSMAWVGRDKGYQIREKVLGSHLSLNVPLCWSFVARVGLMNVETPAVVYQTVNWNGSLFTQKKNIHSYIHRKITSV